MKIKVDQWYRNNNGLFRTTLKDLPKGNILDQKWIDINIIKVADTPQELIQVGDLVEFNMHYYTTFKEIVYNNKQDQPMIRMETSSGSESVVVNSNRVIKIYTPNEDKSQYTLQWEAHYEKQ